MALGKLGSVDITAPNTPQLLATMDEAAIVNVLGCNRNAVDVQIRIAIGSGAIPAAADWIEYDPTVNGYQPIERTGLALSQGEKIWVQSSATGVSFRAHGVPAT
jgi:hypothetical protein